MRVSALLLCLLLTATAWCQEDPITAANKCYDDKNWECAVGKYKEALADKKYQEKDLATIKYRIGFGLKELKQFDVAIPFFKEALQVKSDYPEAYWSLGWCYYSTMDYEQALDYYTKALPGYKDDDKSRGSLYYGRGISNMKLNEYEDALDDFEEAMRLDSTVSNYYSYAGEASYNLENYNTSAMYYRKAIEHGKGEKVPTSARYYWIGQSNIELKDYAKAHEAFQKALGINPDNQSAYWGIAAAYYNESKWPETLLAYTKALEVYKNDTASQKELYYWRGRAYANTKKYDMALVDYEAALKIDPNYRDPARQKAHALFNLKKYKEAIVPFTNAIALYKGVTADLDDLYYFRGASYFQTKDTAKAEADFKESLKLNSNLREPNVHMGHISFSRKDYNSARTFYGKGAPGLVGDTAELAKTWLRKGISNISAADAYLYTGKEDLLKSLSYDSTVKETHRYLADVYYRLNNFSNSEMELTKCIDLYKKVKDSLPLIYMYRGMARSQQKKYKESLTDYELSDKMKPFVNPTDIAVLGQLAFEIKDFDKAGKIFTRIIPMYKAEQKNELMFAYFGRGRAALELKNKEQAVKDLKKALELTPGSKDIETWLAKAEAMN